MLVGALAQVGKWSVVINSEFGDSTGGERCVRSTSILFLPRSNLPLEFFPFFGPVINYSILSCCHFGYANKLHIIEVPGETEQSHLTCFWSFKRLYNVSPIPFNSTSHRFYCMPQRLLFVKNQCNHTKGDSSTPSLSGMERKWNFYNLVVAGCNGLVIP